MVLPKNIVESDLLILYQSENHTFLQKYTQINLQQLLQQEILDGFDSTFNLLFTGVWLARNQYELYCNSLIYNDYLKKELKSIFVGKISSNNRAATWGIISTIVSYLCTYSQLYCIHILFLITCLILGPKVWSLRTSLLAPDSWFLTLVTIRYFANLIDC